MFFINYCYFYTKLIGGCKLCQKTVILNTKCVKLCLKKLQSTALAVLED